MSTLPQICAAARQQGGNVHPAATICAAARHSPCRHYMCSCRALTLPPLYRQQRQCPLCVHYIGNSGRSYHSAATVYIPSIQKTKSERRHKMGFPKSMEDNEERWTENNRDTNRISIYGLRTTAHREEDIYSFLYAEQNRYNGKFRY